MCIARGRREGGFLDGRPERRDMQKFGKTSEEFCRSGHVVSAELVIQPTLDQERQP